MRDRSLVALNHAKQFILSAVAVVTLALPIAISAQDAADWQTRAGGKMAFEVASVKPSEGAFVPSNVPLTPWDDYGVTNGRFRADASLSTYIHFAWKLWPSELQTRELSRLPKWVTSDRYTIEARAKTANPTKDQIRLMVQSLLAERFQLTAHFEAAKDVPVYELRLAKAGQRGPKLIAHADGPPCDKPGISPGNGLPGFPFDCYSLSAIDRPGTTHVLVGSRDVTMDVLAGALSGFIPWGLDRSVIDKTGLPGKFDFTLEWAREPRGLAAADPATLPAPESPTKFEALRDQLGLKLEPAKATLPILVIDKAERPSPN